LGKGLGQSSNFLHIPADFDRSHDATGRIGYRPPGDKVLETPSLSNEILLDVGVLFSSETFEDSKPGETKILYILADHIGVYRNYTISDIVQYNLKSIFSHFLRKSIDELDRQKAINSTQYFQDLLSSYSIHTIFYLEIHVCVVCLLPNLHRNNTKVFLCDQRRNISDNSNPVFEK